MCLNPLDMFLRWNTDWCVIEEDGGELKVILIVRGFDDTISENSLIQMQLCLFVFRDDASQHESHARILIISIP